MRLLLLIPFLFLYFTSQGDTLRIHINLPESLTPDNKLQVDSLLDQMKDKSSILLLSYNSDVSFTQKLIEYLGQKGIVSARIKISPTKDGLGGFADIIYSPGKRKPKTSLSEELQDLIQNAGVGQTLALKNIQFVAGQSKLVTSAFEELNRLCEILKADLKLKIQVEGHVCCLSEQDGDTTTAGYKLSLARAKTVYLYLQQNGISAGRISYEGFSSWRRLRKEVSAAEEAANRRVEIRIIAK